MIEARNISKTYRTGVVEEQVLNGVDFTIRRGDFTSITGASGSGKSTLFYQLSLLDSPTSGTVLINGMDTKSISAEAQVRFRLENLGFVFQDHAILPELTAGENVELPMRMLGFADAERQERVRTALADVGIEEKKDNLPSQLSGGEKQRVSIARATAHSPSIVFADEPTANLDVARSREIFELFKTFHENGQTIVIITHEEEFARIAHQTFKLDAGRVMAVPDQSDTDD